MGPTKGKQQQEGGGDEAPPSYDDVAHAVGSQAAAASVADSKRPQNAPRDISAEPRPTVDSPFNFPPPYTPTASDAGGRAYSDLPEVVESSSSSGGGGGGGVPASSAPGEHTHPYAPLAGSSSGSNTPASSSRGPVLLAIPQTSAQPTSPFLAAYSAPVLLGRGIARATFLSFLATLSAFLGATVSARALAHAGDVGRGLNEVPRRFSRDTVAHVRGVGRQVGASARKGDFLGAGVGALAGAVAVPLSAALRIVDATIHQLPAAAAAGLARRPLAPRDRAAAYAAVAQRDWLAARRLAARLCTTAELVSLLPPGGSGSGSGGVDRLVNLVRGTWESGPEGQLRALHDEFGLAPLEIAEGQQPGGGGGGGGQRPLDIGPDTLWLVLTDVPDKG
ncbi:putative subunit of the RNA polymerase ii mediator complex protein [Rosellinia necatrix]|uniref:Putative subunit of the RNA polymerase ii mediator complex protein n=1 Tax=Rosellinia necatrix TaxID=77044 RepID=A0A1S8A5A1_ROSNE|nr:putative subunit of the RNA polymerase ii mediator complex protein [Rosellinia necatrix]